MPTLRDSLDPLLSTLDTGEYFRVVVPQPLRSIKLGPAVTDGERDGYTVDICAFCHEIKPQQTFAMCSGCLFAFYCNDQYQRLNWPEHGEICYNIRKYCVRSPFSAWLAQQCFHNSTLGYSLQLIAALVLDLVNHPENTGLFYIDVGVRLAPPDSNHLVFPTFLSFTPALLDDAPLAVISNLDALIAYTGPRSRTPVAFCIVPLDDGDTMGRVCSVVGCNVTGEALRDSARSISQETRVFETGDHTLMVRWVTRIIPRSTETIRLSASSKPTPLFTKLIKVQMYKRIDQDGRIKSIRSTQDLAQTDGDTLTGHITKNAMLDIGWMGVN
ncbi:hypothetical protein OF83DRAFT_1087788, partial [Amylostereum chailletii]